MYVQLSSRQMKTGKHALLKFVILYMYTYIYICLCTYEPIICFLFIYVHLYIYIYIHVCMYVCMYVPVETRFLARPASAGLLQTLPERPD
jgi:hypothetical protein